MALKKTEVSVIIRNRGEAVFLERVLMALSVQKGPKPEVILVDNASRDASVAIALRHGATVIHVQEGEFTYGKALNMGFAAASGEICIILSAHSLPLGSGFVNSCLAPFADPSIAAARCVYAGKGSDMTRWAAPEILGRAATLDEIVSKGPLASGCAIRRAVWLKIPFDEHVAAAEDKLWAMRAIDAGYSIFSPCDAFYFYLKPTSPATNFRNNYRDLRAIFLATGARLGDVKSSRLATVGHALWTIASAAPRNALSVIHAQLVRMRLRLAFPQSPNASEQRPKVEKRVVESAMAD